jgi:hypothetical protein
MTLAKLIDELNPQQKEAVDYLGSSLIIIAGAGKFRRESLSVFEIIVESFATYLRV